MMADPASNDSSLAPLSRLAIESLRAAAAADHVTLHLLEPDGQTLVAVATTRPDGAALVGTRQAMVPGGVAREALGSGRIQRIDAAQTEALLPPAAQDLGSGAGLVVPLHRAGQPLGIALVQTADPARTWDGDRMGVLARAAELAAEPLDRATREALLLAAVGRLLAGVDALAGLAAADDLPAAVVAQARLVGGANAAWLRYPDPDTAALVIRVDTDLPEEVTQQVRDVAEAFRGSTGAGGAIYHADTQRGVDVPPELRRLALSADLGSALIWPLIVRGAVTGDVAFWRRESEAFSPEQITTTGAFARFVAPLLMLPSTDASAAAADQPAAATDRARDLSAATAVLEGLPVPAILEGPDGAVAAVNRPFGAVFNADPVALVGATFHTVAVPTIVRLIDGDAEAAQVMRTLRGGLTVRREHAVRLRSGLEGPVIYRAYPLISDAGDPTGRMHIFALDPLERA